MRKGNKMYRGGEKDEGLKPRKEQNGKRMEEEEEEEEERAKKTRRDRKRKERPVVVHYSTIQYSTIR